MKYKPSYGDKQRDAQKRKKEEGRQGREPAPAETPVAEVAPKVESTEKPGKKKKRIA